MTFVHYWTILTKQWKLIVICFVIVGLVTYIVSKLLTPIYQSSVLVEVTLRSVNNQSDYNSLLASDQLVQTEAQLAVSDPVLRGVAAHYKSLTVEQLSKVVTSTIKLNTQLFEIDVSDPSPTRASDLANDVATTLIKQQLQVTQEENSRSQQKIQQDLGSTRQQIDIATTQIAMLQAKGGSQSQVAVLQAQLSGLQQHYSQWQNVLAQLELTEAQNDDVLRVAQTAHPSTSPVRPQVFLNTIIGLLSGLFLGMVLAVLFEQLDTRIRNAEAVAGLLNWPILATVWRVDASGKEDVVNPAGQSANVESYRILRTNIGFSSLDKPLRSLAVTSAVPYEGKSTIAANLAIFMVKAGKNTLLVDTDLRHPTLHQIFDIPGDKMGLSNAVLALSHVPLLSHPPSLATPPGFSLDPYMHSVGIPNLRVMPAGPLPPNPPELLDSKAMERLRLAIASCGAEIVIFDTPALLGLSDTSILASKVDGTLVVADVTRARKGNLKQVEVLMAQAGANVIGCVVNKQKHSHKDARYPYYHYRIEDQQNEGNYSMNNGSVPVIPATPMLSIPPDQQRMPSN